MNPNIPYGQQVPMQPPQRRHDVPPYNQMPPHMRPHPAYQQYYGQHMGPMMPQYPQYYPQQEGSYYQAAVPGGRAPYYQMPLQGGRIPYYPANMPPPPMPHQTQPHHGPLIVSSHPLPQPSPRHIPGPGPQHPSHPPSTASTASVPQIETPPSRPISTASAMNTKKESTPPTISAAPFSVDASQEPSTPGTSVNEWSGPQSSYELASISVAPVAHGYTGSVPPPLPATPSTATVSSSQSFHEPIVVVPAIREPFEPPVPWLSVADEPFPARASRSRRRVLRSSLGTEPITFPLNTESHEQVGKTLEAASELPTTKDQLPTETNALTPTRTPTPNVPENPSSTSAGSTTPSSAVAAARAQTTPTQSKPVRAALPVVPVLPVLPQSPIKTRPHRDSVVSTASKGEQTISAAGQSAQTPELPATEELPSELPSELPGSKEAPPPPPPTSWAALLRNKNAAASNVASGANIVGNGLTMPRNESLGDVLGEINVNETPSKVAFLQPRGLVNTGNMCYMNSILQMLVFCIPFYEFLDKVARRAPHTFKSDTPLIDAMILFMREYPVIDSTTSVDQLRLRLKPEDYERYGDSFVPEYVYNVIKELPRFRDMRRGQQQDAQEFLGFLLEELHEECAHAMKTGTSVSSGTSTPVGSTSNLSEAIDGDGGWMEVGHKQKSAITRSSGAIATESPVTSIFGGKLRSELKISGNKMSVTLEPYQPLQLDIGSQQVNNVIEALKGLTKPESMQGDFQSTRGLKTSATKQVFIETLPPVLILHLKRFHYDAATKRVEKIWKKVGYPLELELPKEVFPNSTRYKFNTHGGLPKYRLIGVIYHHGKNANGGHYTVDIRRQDGREWIRVDDTMIRRIRSEDVAEGGSEEDPKVLAAALQRHNEGKQSGTANRFEQIYDEEEETTPEKQWSQVNGHSRSKSTMSAVVNGASTPAKDSSGIQTPRDRYSIKDNKVAYLLFYQRIPA